MQGVTTELMDLKNLWVSEIGSVCVGQIVEITEEGQALVVFGGNRSGLVAARSVINAPFRRDDYDRESIPVLLVFENGNPTLPIIVGFIHNTLFPSALSEEVSLPIKKPQEIILDGRKVLFDAKEEIVLRCGKSSIILKKDGKIVVKGTQLVSRASEINKIKGASVRIN